MTIGGAGPWIRRQTADSGTARVIAQLWEGQCLISSPGGDYQPFEFFTHGSFVPELADYDPLGIINPSTVAFSGSGSFGGGGPVPAGSSILIPQTGLYRHSFSGHTTVTVPTTDAVDFSAHMGTDETVADIIDGFIGWNWSQQAGDAQVSFPDPLTWIGIVAHTAGAAVYWAGNNNCGSGTVNQFGFTWVIEYIGPLDGGS